METEYVCQCLSFCLSAQLKQPVRMPDSMAEVILSQSSLIAHRIQRYTKRRTDTEGGHREMQRALGALAAASLAAAVWKALAGWPAA
jgi:hypothetical protein